MVRLDPMGSRMAVRRKAVSNAVTQLSNGLGSAAVGITCIP
jgi:hypothetical protein